MSKFKPDNWPSVIPRIIVGDVPGLVEFVKAVFGGEGTLNTDVPTQIMIGDSLIMISDGGGAREPMAAFLYVYLENADLAYQRAMAAGAISIEKPSDMPYGDRRATVRDRWGNIWQMATHQG